MIPVIWPSVQISFFCVGVRLIPDFIMSGRISHIQSFAEGDFSWLSLLSVVIIECCQFP